MKSFLPFKLECSGNLQLILDALMDAHKAQTNGTAVDLYKNLARGGGWSKDLLRMKKKQRRVSHSQGKHFEISPADFLSDVDCAKRRKLLEMQGKK